MGGWKAERAVGVLRGRELKKGGEKWDVDLARISLDIHTYCVQKIRGGWVEGVFTLRFQGGSRGFQGVFRDFQGLEGVWGGVLGSLLEGILGGSWRVKGREKGRGRGGHPEGFLGRFR